MFPIKVKDGMASLVVNKSKKLTRRQINTLNRTALNHGVDASQRYLASLLGLHKEPVKISREKVYAWAGDKLASKPSGSVARMFRELQINDEDTLHRPGKRSPGAWVGVEIECYYPSSQFCGMDCNHDEGDCFPEYEITEEEAQDNIRKALIKAGVTRSSVKGDGSLDSDEGVGVEVTLLFNTEDGFSQLEKVCKVLNQFGCFVDDRCGLHVHLDSRHLKPHRAKLLGQRLGRALPVLKWVVDPSRHANSYCRMETGPFKRNTENRYYAINMQSYFRYKTIEVRMHGGSTNARKIQHWIELLRFIAGSKVSKELETFQDLIDLGAPEHLIEYADRRITKLNPTAWTQLIPLTNKNYNGITEPTTSVSTEGR